MNNAEDSLLLTWESIILTEAAFTTGDHKDTRRKVPESQAVRLNGGEP